MPAANSARVRKNTPPRGTHIFRAAARSFAPYSLITSSVSPVSRS